MGGVFIEYLQRDPRFFVAVVFTVIVSICIHELAHGFTAVFLGDQTPVESGHMTLNPAVHLGIFSVICLLIGGIAWGAMPVDPKRLRGKYADALVALAGPVSNAVLALLAIVGLGLWQRYGSAGTLSNEAKNIRYLLLVFGMTNFDLFIFNLIPIPPLDGSRILASFSPGYATVVRNAGAGAFLSVMLIGFAFIGQFTSAAAWAMTERVLHVARGF